MGLKICCEELAHQYVAHKTMWPAIDRTWFVSLRETISESDLHTLTVKINFCPFCGKKLESECERKNTLDDYLPHGGSPQRFH